MPQVSQSHVLEDSLRTEPLCTGCDVFVVLTQPQLTLINLEQL